MGLLNMQLPWNGFIFKNWLLFLLLYILAKYESLNVLQLSLCIPSQRYWRMDETITQNKHIDLLTYLSQILPKLWPWPPPHFLPQSPEKTHFYKQITSINPNKAWKGMKKPYSFQLFGEHPNKTQTFGEHPNKTQTFGEHPNKTQTFGEHPNKTQT